MKKFHHDDSFQTLEWTDRQTIKQRDRQTDKQTDRPRCTVDLALWAGSTENMKLGLLCFKVTFTTFTTPSPHMPG